VIHDCKLARIYKQLIGTYLQIYRLQVTQQFVQTITEKKIVQMLPNCHSMRCKILCTTWQIIVYAHEFFEEKSPFVQANCRSICCEISLELSSKLSSKSRGNKQQNLRI